MRLAFGVLLLVLLAPSSAQAGLTNRVARAAILQWAQESNFHPARIDGCRRTSAARLVCRVRFTEAAELEDGTYEELQGKTWVRAERRGRCVFAGYNPDIEFAAYRACDL